MQHYHRIILSINDHTLFAKLLPMMQWVNPSCNITPLIHVEHLYANQRLNPALYLNGHSTKKWLLSGGFTLLMYFTGYQWQCCSGCKLTKKKKSQPTFKHHDSSFKPNFEVLLVEQVGILWHDFCSASHNCFRDSSTDFNTTQTWVAIF